jgi:4-amino-4-deoxy-L-arabinose transferase-like glycosyltransferase
VRELFDDYAATIASAVYALMSISPAVVGFAAHATHFVVLAALGGFWCLLRGLKSALLWPIFCSGLLLGTAFMMKQPGVFFGVWAGLALVCARGSTGTNLWLKRLALYSLAAVTPYGLT